MEDTSRDLAETQILESERKWKRIRVYLYVNRSQYSTYLMAMMCLRVFLLILLSRVVRLAYPRMFHRITVPIILAYLLLELLDFFARQRTVGSMWKG